MLDGKACRGSAGGDLELAVDGAQVLADGARTDEESLGDGAVGQSLRPPAAAPRPRVGVSPAGKPEVPSVSLIAGWSASAAARKGAAPRTSAIASLRPAVARRLRAFPPPGGARPGRQELAPAQRGRHTRRPVRARRPGGAPRSRLAGFLRQAAEQLVRGNEHKGLVRVRRFGERVSRAGAGAGHIASDEIVARPTHQSVGPTEMGAAPGNPPVVGFQPWASARGFISVEGEVGGKARRSSASGKISRPGGVAGPSVRRESIWDQASAGLPSWRARVASVPVTSLSSKELREGIPAQNGLGLHPTPR